MLLLEPFTKDHGRSMLQKFGEPHLLAPYTYFH
jgi:hypothetical protein